MSYKNTAAANIRFILPSFHIFSETPGLLPNTPVHIQVYCESYRPIRIIRDKESAGLSQSTQILQVQ